MNGQVSLFDLQPHGTFEMKIKLLKMVDGVPYTSADFYCSICGAELFHNGAMMQKVKCCRNCGAELIPSEELQKELADREKRIIRIK